MSLHPGYSQLGVRGPQSWNLVWSPSDQWFLLGRKQCKCQGPSSSSPGAPKALVAKHFGANSYLRFWRSSGLWPEQSRPAAAQGTMFIFPLLPLHIVKWGSLREGWRRDTGCISTSVSFCYIGRLAVLGLSFALSVIYIVHYRKTAGRCSSLRSEAEKGLN